MIVVVGDVCMMGIGSSKKMVEMVVVFSVWCIFSDCV